MSTSLALHQRPQSRPEEIANSVSHGIALAAALAAAPFLVMIAVERRDTAGVVGASVFAASLLLLYLVSTLYHALPRSRAKSALRIADHAAIFVLIAGSYTPFTLGVLRGPWGWTLFGIVWGLAAAGILMKALNGVAHPRLSTGLYLVMGWCALVAIGPLWERVPAWGLFWLFAGGLAYTVGVAFFASDERVRFNHFRWHLFVIAGSACHVIAVAGYAG
jgi:hemolysin III